MEFLLLGLLGVGALATFVGGSDDNDENDDITGTDKDDTLVLDADMVSNTDQVLLGDGDDALDLGPAASSLLGVHPADAPLLAVYGENGDDFISASSDEINSDLDGELIGLEIYGGEGDDSLSSNGNAVGIFGGVGDDTISAGNYADVHGDEGNDIITAESWSTAYGGDGDDVLFGGSAATVYGGEGDDTLEYSSNNDSENVARIYGGDGDDRFILHKLTNPADDPYAGDDDGGAFIFGGAGNDTYVSFESTGMTTDPDAVEFDSRPGIIDGEGSNTYELKLTLNDYDTNSVFAEEVPPETQEDSIQGYTLTAGEDVLIIDISPANDEVTRELESAELVQSDDYATLVMTFQGAEGQPELVTTIRINGENVTMDDIIITPS